MIQYGLKMFHSIWKSCQPSTPQELVSALNKAGQENLASSLLEAFETGKKPERAGRYFAARGQTSAQFHQLFADSCHGFCNFPNASPEALRLSQPQLWQRIEQLQEAISCISFRGRQLHDENLYRILWTSICTPPAPILSGDLASGS